MKRLTQRRESAIEDINREIELGRKGEVLNICIRETCKEYGVSVKYIRKILHLNK